MWPSFIGGSLDRVDCLVSKHFTNEAENFCVMFTFLFSGIEKDKNSKNIINMKGARRIVEVSIKELKTITSRHVFVT